MKICKTCNIEKSLDLFGKSKRHKDGLLTSCKGCTTLKRKKYFDKNLKALEASLNCSKQDKYVKGN